MTVFKTSQTSNLKPQTSNLKPQTSNLKLKSLLYLFLLAIVFTNCEKDDSYTQDNNVTLQPKEKGYTVKEVTLKEVKQSSLIKSSLDNIENQFDFNKLNTSKKSKNIGNTNTSAAASNGPINSKDNTFTILTDEILQVSTDSTDVYTFRIEIPTKPEFHFENFVIHKRSNGSIAYYIYSYKNYNDDFSVLNVSRKKVNEDQINIGDFDDYIPSYKEYDPGSGCWIEVTRQGNDLVITFSDCEDGGSGEETEEIAEVLVAMELTALGYIVIPMEIQVVVV